MKAARNQSNPSSLWFSLSIAGVALSAPLQSASLPLKSVVMAAYDDAIGLWTPSDGRNTCRIALNNIRVPLGRGAAPEGCKGTLSLARAWRSTPGGIELIDSRGRTLIQFRRVTADRYTSLDGSVTLERASEF